MDPEKQKDEGYRMYVTTFISLSVLTLFAVWIKSVRFAPVALVGIIMSIAVIQALIVMFYNMHLKVNDRILLLFSGIIFSLIFLTIIITMLDFAYR